MQIWLKSANQFMRYGAHKPFGFKFGSLSPAVTLKIMSRSPKPNQLFIMSQCYIHANSVKIHPPVHETACKQESVTLDADANADANRILTKKQYGRLPFGGGHNYMQQLLNRVNYYFK